MFIKKITKGNKEDKQYTYYRLCQSVRIGTKTRHHNLLNLGSLEFELILCCASVMESPLQSFVAPSLISK